MERAAAAAISELLEVAMAHLSRSLLHVERSLPADEFAAFKKSVGHRSHLARTSPSHLSRALGSRAARSSLGSASPERPRSWRPPVDPGHWATLQGPPITEE